jgi:hypothetical protein
MDAHFAFNPYAGSLPLIWSLPAFTKLTAQFHRAFELLTQIIFPHTKVDTFDEKS